MIYTIYKLAAHLGRQSTCNWFLDLVYWDHGTLSWLIWYGFWEIIQRYITISFGAMLRGKQEIHKSGSCHWSSPSFGTTLIIIRHHSWWWSSSLSFSTILIIIIIIIIIRHHNHKWTSSLSTIIIMKLLKHN